jgi:hypothetical protein
LPRNDGAGQSGPDDNVIAAHDKRQLWLQ